MGTHQQVVDEHIQMLLRRRRLLRQRLKMHEQNTEKDLQLLSVVGSERDGVACADALNDRAHLSGVAIFDQAKECSVRGGSLISEGKLAATRSCTVSRLW